MKIERFEELPIWQGARTLSKLTYQTTDNWRDFALRDQMRRAAVSVASNIAEGFERGTNKEFVQFLYIAKGSLGELRSQIVLASDINFLSEKKFIECEENCLRLSTSISNLIKYLRSTDLRERQKISK